MTTTKAVRLSHQLGIALASLIFLCVLGSAGAAGIDFETSMSPAAKLICDAADGFIKSPLLTAGAFGMFLAGGAMAYFKVRGGLSLMITAFVGYVLLKQIIPIAKVLGLLPKGC